MIEFDEKLFQRIAAHFGFEPVELKNYLCSLLCEGVALHETNALASILSIRTGKPLPKVSTESKKKKEPLKQYEAKYTGYVYGRCGDLSLSKIRDDVGLTYYYADIEYIPNFSKTSLRIVNVERSLPPVQLVCCEVEAHYILEAVDYNEAESLVKQELNRLEKCILRLKFQDRGSFIAAIKAGD